MTESRIESLPIHKPYYPHDSIYIISQRWEKINAFLRISSTTDIFYTKVSRAFQNMPHSLLVGPSRPET